MDLIQEAKNLGFSDAAVMDTKDLVFKPEYRKFCEENQCGNYNLNPACPPESGTVEEMMAQALKYEKTLVLQTIQTPEMEYKKAKHSHNQLTEQLAKQLKAAGMTDQTLLMHVRLLCGCPGDGGRRGDDLLGTRWKNPLFLTDSVSQK